MKKEGDTENINIKINKCNAAALAD
jgi:hypothetical protein